jgi:hypothetical protein
MIPATTIRVQVLSDLLEQQRAENAELRSQITDLKYEIEQRSDTEQSLLRMLIKLDLELNEAFEEVVRVTGRPWPQAKWQRD